MADRIVDVSVVGSTPWSGMTSCFKFGDLSGVLDLSGEHGMAGGPDLSDETQANIVATDSKLRIQFRGSDFGCLTFDPDARTGIHSGDVSQLDFTVRDHIIMRLDADEGLTMWTDAAPIMPILSIRRHGNVTSTGADIDAHARLGLSCKDDMVFIVDTGNVTTNRKFSFRADGVSNDNSRAVFYIHEQVRAGMQLPNVYHQATGIVTDTDGFFEIRYDESNAGGARLIGMKDSSVASGEEGGSIALEGYLEDNADSDKTINARGLIELKGAQLSGGSIANVATNGNLVVIRTRSGGAWETRWILDHEGDLYTDGSTYAFDEEDDARAVSDLYHILCGESDSVVKYDRKRLEKMKAISGETRPLISKKVTTALIFGSIRQLRDQLDKVTNKIYEMEAQLGI